MIYNTGKCPYFSGIERLVQMYLNDPKFVNEAEIQDVFHLEKEKNNV